MQTLSAILSYISSGWHYNHFIILKLSSGKKKNQQVEFGEFYCPDKKSMTTDGFQMTLKSSFFFFFF